MVGVGVDDGECRTRDRAMKHFFVPRSVHPTGPISQSAQIKNFFSSTVLVTPMFSNCMMSSRTNHSVTVSHSRSARSFFWLIFGKVFSSLKKTALSGQIIVEGQNRQWIVNLFLPSSTSSSGSRTSWRGSSAFPTSSDIVVYFPRLK